MNIARFEDCCLSGVYETPRAPPLPELGMVVPAIPAFEMWRQENHKLRVIVVV